jgi:hypothetical protein
MGSRIAAGTTRRVFMSIEEADGEKPTFHQSKINNKKDAHGRGKKIGEK